MNKRFVKTRTTLFILLLWLAATTSVKLHADIFQDVSLAVQARSSGNLDSALSLLNGIDLSTLTVKQQDALVFSIVEICLMQGKFTNLSRIPEGTVQMLSKVSRTKIMLFGSLQDCYRTDMTGDSMILPMLRGSIPCSVNGLTLDLSVSSEFTQTLIITDRTARGLPGLTILGKFREWDEYLNRWIPCRLAVLKSMRIGPIRFDLVPVIIKPGSSNRINLGLFSGLQVILDYQKESMIIEKKVFFSDTGEYLQLDLSDIKPAVATGIRNWGFSSMVPIDLAEGVTILPRTLFTKSYIADYFFGNKEVVTGNGVFYQYEKIPWTQDADFLFGTTLLYNRTVFLAPSHSTIPPALTRSLFEGCRLYFDLVSMKLRVENLLQKKEQCIEYISENRLIECIDFLKKCDLSDDLVALFRAIVMHRSGHRSAAVELLLTKLQTMVQEKQPLDHELLYYAILYIEYAAEDDEMKRLKSVIMSDQDLHSDPLISRILAVSRHADQYGITSGDSGRIGYRLENNKIYPRLNVNNKNVSKIIFDTGWPLLTFCRSDARRMGIEVVARNAVSVTSGFRNQRVLYWDVGLVSRLELGGIVVENVLCTITPFPVFPGVRGAIGGALLNRFDYIIDGPTHSIYFKRRSGPTGTLTDPLNLYCINDKPYVICQPGDDAEQEVILFDSGNDFTFATFPLLIKNKKDIRGLEKGTEGNIDVLGMHFYPVLRQPIDIKIGEVSIEFPDFIYRDGPEFHFPELVKNYGNIGYERFTDARIIVNWSKGHFQIQLPQKSVD